LMNRAEKKPELFDANKLEEAVGEFVEHLHDDLPPGPPSELGGEVPSFRTRRTEAEFRRMAALGKAMVDGRIAARKTG